MDRSSDVVERLEDSGWDSDERQAQTEWGFRSPNGYGAEEQGPSQRQFNQGTREPPQSPMYSPSFETDNCDYTSPGLGSNPQFDASEEDRESTWKPGIAQVSRISQLRGDERVSCDS